MLHPFAKVRLLNYFSYLFLVVSYCNRRRNHCNHKYCYSTNAPFLLLHRLLAFKSRNSLDFRNNSDHSTPCIPIYAQPYSFQAGLDAHISLGFTYSIGNAIGSLVLFDGFLSMMLYAYATMIFFLLNGILDLLVQGICRSSFPLHKAHIVPFYFTNALCDQKLDANCDQLRDDARLVPHRADQPWETQCPYVLRLLCSDDRSLKIQNLRVFLVFQALPQRVCPLRTILSRAYNDFDRQNSHKLKFGLRSLDAASPWVHSLLYEPEYDDSTFVFQMSSSSALLLFSSMRRIIRPCLVNKIYFSGRKNHQKRQFRIGTDRKQPKS